jgi:hypothetical protein
VDLVMEEQASPTRYPFGSGASKATELFIKRMATNEKRSVHKLNGAVHAREPGQFSPLVEKYGVPSYTNLEGTDVIPKWETECARHAT